MIIIKPAIVLTLSLLSLLVFSTNATAMVTEVSGETICTTVSLIDKEIVRQSPCSYKGATGASMVYFVQQLNFKINNSKIISTVNNATFRFGEAEEMLDLEETISINDQPAEVILIDARTIKKLSKKEIESYYDQSEPDFANVWHCFKPINKSQAFCIPNIVIYNMS